MSTNIFSSLDLAIDEYNSYQTTWRQVNVDSDDLRRLSKRAIFHINREEIEKAEALIQEAEELLNTIMKNANSDELLLSSEGYKVGVEEFLEAYLLFSICSDKGIKIDNFVISPTRKLGAFSDICGELARQSVMLGAKRKTGAVKKNRDRIEQILLKMSEAKIVENSYLRNKYDQADRALRKVEGILYDLEIRS